MFREPLRLRAACPAAAGLRLPDTARGGRSTVDVTTQCGDRTPVPAGLGVRHKSRRQAGPMAADRGQVRSLPFHVGIQFEQELRRLV
jgi:hypothetical protein